MGLYVFILCAAVKIPSFFFILIGACSYKSPKSADDVIDEIQVSRESVSEAVTDMTEISSSYDSNQVTGRAFENPAFSDSDEEGSKETITKF